MTTRRSRARRSGRHGCAERRVARLERCGGGPPRASSTASGALVPSSASRSRASGDRRAWPPASTPRSTSCSKPQTGASGAASRDRDVARGRARAARVRASTPFAESSTRAIGARRQLRPALDEHRPERDRRSPAPGTSRRPQTSSGGGIGSPSSSIVGSPSTRDGDWLERARRGGRRRDRRSPRSVDGGRVHAAQVELGHPAGRPRSARRRRCRRQRRRGAAGSAAARTDDAAVELER